ncbi:UPF0481 protein [Actinidia chinensis var. chinensis]|uniref:UPF0481 protein n=1 Tax=Actinidia chinensis var. chinensis TaxID=1590841 RepID=A0A2R6RKV0_ACTCC|nr:UPF0481 protein [Actinidia chinensis var. chinensis]
MSEWLARVELELEGLQDASSVSTTDLVDPWMRRCIYKVPASVKDLNKKAYEPQLVSFGPYHHGEEHLRPMEEHKQRSLLHFIKRSNKPLTLYFNYLLEVVQDLKDSYDSLDPYWQRDNDRFLQLMILDGCFMLELLRCTTDGPPKDYFKTDPIFSDHGKAHIVPYVKRDMLLLENQLPIMVLHKLVAVEAGKDLLRVKFSHIRKTQRNRNDRDGKVIGSAMKLYEAGIRFKRSRTASLKDISFSRDGVLSLPFIVVDDTTESTLLNLIAFERLHIGAGTVVTNYVFFMACILKSARDISLLESQQIILNAIGSDTDIVEFFKSLSKEIANDPEDELDQLHRQIIMYLDKPSNKLRAHIVHAYHKELSCAMHVPSTDKVDILGERRAVALVVVLEPLRMGVSLHYIAWER